LIENIYIQFIIGFEYILGQLPYSSLTKSENNRTITSFGRVFKITL